MKKERIKKAIFSTDRKNRSIVIMDDPLAGFVSPEQETEVKKKFDSWIIKRIESINPNIPRIVLHHRVYERDIYQTKTNENMRTSPPKKTSLRLELEEYVSAWNTPLKEAVKTMDIIILLRNAHPTYRSTFASQAFEIGLITDWQRKEFVIGPPPREYSRTNWKS
jgi:hypothetical protein